MKISVRVRGEWLQVPCKKGDETIQWLSEESVRRYFRLQSGSNQQRLKTESILSVRKTRGGAILDPKDGVADVLDDNDFISVVLESDKPHPVTDQPQIKYIPEQIAASELPTDQYLTLDGNTLTPDDLVMLGKGSYRIRLSKESEEKVVRARKIVDRIVRENKDYLWITTGVGKFARTVIPQSDIEAVQLNVIRSHSAGVGNPLSPDKTRMLLALRVNVLAKGHSGISLKTLQQYIDAFNASCLPWVPEKGTVGASGDLAPLSHLALGLLGEGKMWSPKTGWGNAATVLEAYNLKPLSLGAKEALALINGTQLISSFGAEAVVRAENIAKQGDIVASLTLEVLKGTSRAFDESVMKLRNHKGQQEVAKRLTALLHSETYPSEIAESHRFCNRVQDAYTLRCCPQVHGIVHDTINFVRGILTDELNSATDNPIILSDRGEIISAGNFHGEYPAKVLDYLAIAIHEMASMSERRIERLVNPAYSELPAFLVKEGGMNSGFMLAHCTAASLVSENKVLCHPASVDSLTTSGGTEDHVFYGWICSTKSSNSCRKRGKSHRHRASRGLSSDRIPSASQDYSTSRRSHKSS
ncbi:Histidine ammonia-lyase [Armadillidium nasatum]|uniref:Histidine ammonia-lyase n=1 Tax=Armadillidium nasatum TaxID=96803 RepID=A0A5N5T4L1_9CRUS|nr:Histidine ammonia-lyase [Armadillidium nasatum]